MPDNNPHALKEKTILIGRSYQYRILRMVGSGTFGITYMAAMYDPDGNFTGQYAAVKELFMSDFSTRDGDRVVMTSHMDVFANYFKQFRREAESLSNLRLDNVVKVYECFETNDTIYYSMSYIDGGTLDKKIEAQGHLSEDEALRITKQLAEALRSLHKSGMLHLDIKPSNVMLSGGVTPMLIDFGLARHFSADGGSGQSFVSAPGTEGYAPIEQGIYHGGSGDIPYTLDVYALGSTLFKMLTGNRAPSASAVREYGLPEDEMRDKGVSEEVIAMVKGAMHYHYRERYPDMGSLLSDIESIENCRREGRQQEILLDRRTPGERFDLMADRLREQPDVDVQVSPPPYVFAEVVQGMPPEQIAEGMSPEAFAPMPASPVPNAMPELEMEKPRKRRAFVWSAVASFALLFAVGFGAYTMGVFDSKPKTVQVDEEEEALEEVSSEAKSDVPTVRIVKNEVSKSYNSEEKNTNSKKEAATVTRKVKIKEETEVCDSAVMPKWSTMNRMSPRRNPGKAVRGDEMRK